MKINLHLILIFTQAFLLYATAVADAGSNTLNKSRPPTLTPNEKRNAVLDIIDKGHLKKGIPFSVLPQLLGKDFGKTVKLREDGSGFGVFSFEPFVKRGEDDPGYYVGWYLVVEHDGKGIITNYYLSNVHK